MTLKLSLLIASLSAVSPAVLANDVNPAPLIAPSESDSAQTLGSQTYTYVRCWYRPAATHNDPYTTWEWAKKRGRQ